MSKREFNWLRGMDLNHRPLGYEPEGQTQTPVDSVALLSETSETPAKTTQFLYLRFAEAA